MFKIESYVTPILLSYVDKYVRDFKPADAQVSVINNINFMRTPEEPWIAITKIANSQWASSVIMTQTFLEWKEAYAQL